MVTPGELVLVYFPFSVAEAEPFKQRPVLVVNEVRDGDTTVLFAMVTANSRRFENPRPGDVPLEDWQACGLAAASVVRTRRIWTGERRDIIRAIGRVPAPVLDQVRDLIVGYVRPAA